MLHNPPYLPYVSKTARSFKKIAKSVSEPTLVTIDDKWMVIVETVILKFSSQLEAFFAFYNLFRYMDIHYPRKKTYLELIDSLIFEKKLLSTKSIICDVIALCTSDNSM